MYFSGQPADAITLNRKSLAACVQDGLDAEEGVDADLRPGLEPVPVGAEVGDGDEPGLGQGVLAGADGGAVEVVDVDDPQVDPADGGGVVVDQADPAERAGAADLDLLVELAAQGHLVGVEGAAAVGVGLGDVAADPQRPEPAEPGLAPRLAPRVAEDRAARRGRRRRG